MIDLLATMLIWSLWLTLGAVVAEEALSGMATFAVEMKSMRECIKQVRGESGAQSFTSEGTEENPLGYLPEDLAKSLDRRFKSDMDRMISAELATSLMSEPHLCNAQAHCNGDACFKSYKGLVKLVTISESPLEMIKHEKIATMEQIEQLDWPAEKKAQMLASEKAAKHFITGYYNPCTRQGQDLYNSLGAMRICATLQGTTPELGIYTDRVFRDWIRRFEKMSAEDQTPKIVRGTEMSAANCDTMPRCNEAVCKNAYEDTVNANYDFGTTAGGCPTGEETEVETA